MSNFQTFEQISGGIPGTAVKLFSASTVDSEATLLVAGYLNDKSGIVKQNDIIYINYLDTSTYPLTVGENSTPGQYQVTVSGSTISLTVMDSGEITFPVQDNHVPLFDGTSGRIKNSPLLYSSDSFQIPTGNVVAGTGITATTGDINATAGSINAGLSVTADFNIIASQNIGAGGDITATGNVKGNTSVWAGAPTGIPGYFISYPPTAGAGSLKIQASDTSTNNITITNGDFDQSDITLTIPNCGGTTGTFVMSPGDGRLITGNGINDIYYGLIVRTVSVNYTDLNTGAGGVILLPNSGLHKYQILNMTLSQRQTMLGGTNTRGAIITDGIQTFGTLSAATLQTQPNCFWLSPNFGGPTLPCTPEELTGAGAILTIQGDNVGTNYTAGSFGLTIVAIQFM